MAEIEPRENVPPVGGNSSTLSDRELPVRRRAGWVRRTARRVGWLFASPTEWFGVRSVKSGAASIGRLYQGMRPPRHRDRRVSLGDGKAFDKAATAFNYGISPEELERRLAVRRRQTARFAYALFTIGCLFVLSWLWVASRTPSELGRLVMLLRFFPFCVLFYLLSFYNALVNFQIRTGRAANWMEYISTERGFLPR